MYCLETGSHDPFYNLAFEETVLTERTEGAYCILWRNDNAVVIGQNQNAEAEINRRFVETHGIRVVRRMSGGGAVYHDLGNLNFSFITDLGDAESSSLVRFSAPVVHALQKLGLPAEASGRNDILIGGKKVSGTAQRIMRGRILYHGTLLFDADPGMIAGALNADPEKFRSKSTKSVRARVCNIRPLLQHDMDMDAFCAFLRGELTGGAFSPAKLTETELDAVQTLRDTKYATREWNFGRSPAYTMRTKRRFDAGSVEVFCRVERGVVQDIAFYGDFLSRRPMEDVTDRLTGRCFAREDFADVLARFDLPDYFGGVGADELLNLLFG